MKGKKMTDVMTENKAFVKASEIPVGEYFYEKFDASDGFGGKDCFKRTTLNGHEFDENKNIFVLLDDAVTTISGDEIVRRCKEDVYQTSVKNFHPPIFTEEEKEQFKQRNNASNKKSDEIYNQVNEYIEDADVYYSAYTYDENDVPINNLDEIAVEGKVIFRQKADGYHQDGGEDYESEVVEDPTWMDVCKLADDMIKATKDYHHQFLESIAPLKKDDEPVVTEDGVPVYRFGMGS